MENNLTFRVLNWNKTTPKRWRNVGDAIMVAGSGIGATVVLIPIPDNIKVWILGATTLMTTIGKFLTKFFSED